MIFVVPTSQQFPVFSPNLFFKIILVGAGCYWDILKTGFIRLYK